MDESAARISWRIPSSEEDGEDSDDESDEDEAWTSQAVLRAWGLYELAPAGVLDEGGSGIEGDSSRDTEFYLKDAEAVRLCRSIMTSTEERNANDIGLPLPIAGVWTTEACHKYYTMAQSYGKAPDFSEMAKEWNRSVYQTIADAVKNKTGSIPRVYFTDKHRLKQHAAEVKRRVSSNVQFQNSKESFASHNREMDKDAKALKEAMAMETLDDLLAWLQSVNGGLGGGCACGLRCARNRLGHQHFALLCRATHLARRHGPRASRSSASGDSLWYGQLVSGQGKLGCRH